MPQLSPHPATIAIVLAGGSGVRFGSETNKVLVRIGDRPVLAYSLATFERCHRIDAIVIVARAGDESAIAGIVETAGLAKLAAVVPGGDTRQASEWAGIQAAAELGLDGATVLLHDAARPFLTSELLERILDDRAIDDLAIDHRAIDHRAIRRGGTIPTTPIAAALVDSAGRLVPTDDLMRVQTPQAFPLDQLLDVYPRAEADGFAGVDTAETVQHYVSGATRWVLGDPLNIKVTHPDDRERAEALAREFVDGRWSTTPSID